MNRIKHFMILALALTLSLGAWAQTHQRYSGPVAFSDLQVDDTLAPGFSITGLGSSQTLSFQGNRYKQDGVLEDGNYSFYGNNVTGYGGDNPVTIIAFGSSLYTPVNESGQDGNAWVVTATANNFVRIGGISLAPDPYVPALDETTGHWNFLMPGSNKVVKAVLYDSIVLGPHVELYDADPAFAAGDIYHRGDSTIYYYDTNNHHSFYLRADEQAGGKYFGYWADLDPTDYYYTDRTYRRVSTGSFTCGQRFTAAYLNNYTLTLNPSAGGTLSVLLGDGIIDASARIYTLTFTGFNNGNMNTSVQVNASEFPVTLTHINGNEIGGDNLWNDFAWVNSADASNDDGKMNCSVYNDYHNFSITISGAFDGTANIHVDGANGDWGGEARDISVSCVLTTNDIAYSVMEGLTVNVTATPDSAHYLASIDGHDTVGNYATGYSFVMPSSDKNLEATFNVKPTLTLAQTDGGTLDAIVPQGEPVLLTTIIPTASAISTHTQTNDTVTVTLSGDLEWGGGGWIVGYGDGYYGSVSVTAAAGFDIAYYKFYFSNGDPYIVSEETAAVYPYFSSYYLDQLIYSQLNGQGQQIGSGAVTRIEVYTPGTANVTRIGTTNQYYIDYGTPVTVVATPDAQHYLVSFSDDDPATERNSNLAVEKTYDSVIAPIPLSANFQAKPTLTLTANDGGTLTLDGMTEATPATATIEFAGNNNTVTVSNVTLPHTFSCSYATENGELDQIIKNLYGISSGYNQPAFPPTASGNDNVTAGRSGNNHFITISAPFDGTAAVTGGGYWKTSGEETEFEYNLTITILSSTPGSTGLPAGVVSANATLDTFVVDYNTTVTLQATPDATHYLATLGGVTMGSNTAKDTTFALTAPTNLAANFTPKPTLTLAHNDGGEMEIVPAGGVTAEEITTSLISSWESADEPMYGEHLQPFGFVAVDSNTAKTWTGAPASGEAYLIYNFDGIYAQYVLFTNGQPERSIGRNVYKIQLYGWLSEYNFYFTTGVTPSNVTATAEPNTNTYYIDYGTSVTVKATPSDTAYLVRFDQDADTNSNTAVEKTYGPLTAALTTATATFNAKPVLTLAQNEADWGSVTIPTVLVATDPTPAPTPTAVANPVITGVLMPDGSMQVTMSCTTQDADIYYTTDNVTSPKCDCAAAPEYTHPITFTEPVTLMAAAYDGNNWSAVVTKTITLSLPAGVAQLTDTTYRVDYGTTVTVTADATDLHHVKNWVDADSVAYPADSITYSAYFITTPEPLFPDSSTLTITVTADTMTKAVFGINSYDVVATAQLDDRAEIGTDTSMGYIAVSYIDIVGDAQTVDPADSVEITAQGGSASVFTVTPHYGYLFTGWYDADEDTLMGTAETLTLTEAYEVEARFVPDTFEVTTVVAVPADTLASAGSVAGADRYAYRELVTLIETPATGYHFDHWSNTDSTNLGTDTAVTVQLMQDTVVFAVMDTNIYRITMLVNDEYMGRVFGTDSVKHFLSAQYTARPEWGVHFLSWNDEEGDTISKANPLTLWPISDTTLTAVFEINSYIVNFYSSDTARGYVTSLGNGSVITDGSYSATHSQVVNFTAHAKEGFKFSNWDNGMTDTTVWIVVISDTSMVANFVPTEHTVTVSNTTDTMGGFTVSGATVVDNGDGTYTVEDGDIITVTAVPASSCYDFFLWNDENESEASGNVSRTYVVTDDLTVGGWFKLHVYTGDTTALACDQFVWHGVTYTATPDTAPTYVYATAADGCDSTVTLHLTVNSSTSSTDVQTACDSLTWLDGVTYTTGTGLLGAPTYTTTNAAGCDSVITLQLTMKHSTATSETVTVCDSMLWNGTWYTESGDYEYTTTNAAGCDSTATLHLTVNTSGTTEETVEACDSYTWNGETYFVSGDYVDTVSGQQCDIVATLHLTIKSSTASNDIETACDSYTWIDSVTYTSGTGLLGGPTYTLTNAAGCDSIVTLRLTINHSTTSSESVTACDSMLWNGTWYTESGDYEYTTTNAAGCDSTATLHLTISTTGATEETVEACDSYTWNGETYFVSGDYVDTVSGQQCDIVATLHLTIKSSTASTDIEIACDSYTWIDSVTYTTGTGLLGAPTYTLTNAAGCDSVVVLQLTINNSNSSTDVQSACDSYTWIDGVTYTTSTGLLGAPTYTTTNVAGCDSVITLQLTINSSNSGTDNVTACDSYTWIDGVTYTSGTGMIGAPTYTLTNVAGCDSVVTLHLTMNYSTTGSDSAEACESYTWNDMVYTTSGTYTQVLATTAGCDSTVTMAITIYQPANTSESATACESYTWHGTTYTVSGTYTYDFVDVHGCNAVATLNLTISNGVSIAVTAEACDSYTWNGQQYTVSGDYTYSHTDASECTTVDTLHLTIKSSTSSVDIETACDSYTWIDGVTYTESTGLIGAPTYTLTNAAGCDSIVTLSLVVKNSYQATDVRSACDSLTWVDGVTYTESTMTPTYTVTAGNGCDSTVTLSLMLKYSVATSEDVTVCDSYVWNGTEYTVSGTYSDVFAAGNGCDSTVTLNLTVNYSINVEMSVTECDSYEWNGREYRVSGRYVYNTTTVAGCDSSVVLYLTINYSHDTTITLQGEGSIEWNGEVFTEIGRYERVIPTVNGCDSNVTLNLIILPEGFVEPYLYNIMDVLLSLNRNQEGVDHFNYISYRWYRDDELVAECDDCDTYSEGGDKLDGCYYVEVAIDENREYWMRSNTVCIGNEGIAEVEGLEFTIAPNPVKKGSRVAISTNVDASVLNGAEVSVYDAHGREVIKQNDTLVIEANLPTGMYMVRLRLSDGRTSVGKLIVK